MLTSLADVAAHGRLWAVLWANMGNSQTLELPILFYPQIDLHFTLKLVSSLQSPLVIYPQMFIVGFTNNASEQMK